MKNKDDIESLTRAAKQAFNSEPPNYEAAFLAYSEAIGLLQFNKGSEAESSEVFFQRGRTLMAMGKFPEAIYDFTWAIKNVTPIKEESQKQKSNLMDSIKEDKEIPQKQAKYNRFAGNCYFEMSQYQEALAHYNEANKKEPDSAQNWFNLGLVRSKMGKLVEANKALKTALEKFGTDKANQLNVYYCRYNMGINHRKLGDLDSSVQDLKEAIALFQDKPSVYNNLGLTYFEKNEMDLAIENFSKAIKIEPQAVFYNNRGLAYFHDGQDIAAALQNFDEALALNTTGDPTIYFNRGNALLSEDRFDEAIADYEKAALIAPQNPKYHHAKGIAYEAIAAKIEKVDGKQKRFDLEDLPVEQRYADDMQSYLRDDYLQNCKQAIEQYKKAISVDENFYQSRFHLGRCLAQIFNYSEAIKHYKKIIET